MEEANSLEHIRKASAQIAKLTKVVYKFSILKPKQCFIYTDKHTDSMAIYCQYHI